MYAALHYPWLQGFNAHTVAHAVFELAARRASFGEGVRAALAPSAEYFQTLHLPDALIHWGHPGLLQPRCQQAQELVCISHLAHTNAPGGPRQEAWLSCWSRWACTAAATWAGSCACRTTRRWSPKRARCTPPGARHDRFLRAGRGRRYDEPHHAGQARLCEVRRRPHRSPPVTAEPRASARPCGAPQAALRTVSTAAMLLVGFTQCPALHTQHTLASIGGVIVCILFDCNAVRA